MKKILFLMTFALPLTSCNAQEGKSEKDEFGEKNNNSPRISWDVNKEVDENGNIIRYDSSYSWTYTNMGGDSMQVNPDSVIRSYFNQNFPSLWDQNFGSMPNDSLFYRDFFRDDFFRSGGQQYFFDTDEMFRRMDSLKNQFFKENYRNLDPPAKAKTPRLKEI